MRLKSIHISQYKNLKNFDLAFDGNSFIDVFVGKNGTGKSNLFEALIEIFRHLYEYDKEKAELEFNYRISFEIDGKKAEISWTSGQFKINGKDRKTIGETPLPDNVLIYYSGHNDTVPQLVEQYRNSRGLAWRAVCRIGTAWPVRHGPGDHPDVFADVVVHGAV